MIHSAVSSGNNNIGRKSEDVLTLVGRVLYAGSIVICTASVAAECTLVAVTVGFKLTVVAVEIILVPCLGNGHTGRCTLILYVGCITQGNKCGSSVAVNHVFLNERVIICICGHTISVILVYGFGKLVARSVSDVRGHKVAGCVVVIYCKFLNGLTVNITAVFGVKALCDNLAEAEEVALMTVTVAVGIFKRCLHQRAVINSQCRHNPLATGKSVGRSRVCIVKFKASTY